MKTIFILLLLLPLIYGSENTSKQEREVNCS